MRVLNFLSIASFFLIPFSFAEETPVTTDVIQPLDNISVMQVVTPMIIVISLIFLLAWLTKKLQSSRMSAGKGITVLSSTALSGQARICLVRIGDADILLGVSSQQVTHLKTFKGGIANLDEKERIETEKLSTVFGNLLKKKSPEK